MRPRRARVDYRRFLRPNELERLEAGETVLIQTYRLPHGIRPEVFYFWLVFFPDGHVEAWSHARAVQEKGWIGPGAPKSSSR